MSIVLQTERLVLREWEDADRAALVRIADQPSVNSWLPDWLECEKWAKSWIEGIQRHYLTDDPMKEYLGWALVLKKTNAVIGQINVGPFEEKELGIGYFLDESYCNQGYVTEAAQALIAHVFEKYGYDHIIAMAQPENHASNAVIRKLGYRFIEVIHVKENGQTDVLPFNYYRLDTPYTREKGRTPDGQ